MIEVDEPGFLTSVQTAGGRAGWRHVGVPVGGAADPWSARLANRLVGNSDDGALLEITLTGPTLRFLDATTIALVGAQFEASFDGVPMATNVGRHARGGSLLRIGRGTGARCYLAVAGGLVTDRVLGSVSTDLRSGFGGHEGRALRRGDRLETGASAGTLRRWRGTFGDGPIRIVSGVHADGLQQLSGVEWTVNEKADRTGVRLDGGPIRLEPAEVASMALPLGAIQVPPDGRPIVMLADRPVTGGYPVPAVVIRADIGRVAQLLPSQAVRFELVSTDEARRLLGEMERELAAVEAIDPSTDDEPGWAGALR